MTGGQKLFLGILGIIAACVLCGICGVIRSSFGDREREQAADLPTATTAPVSRVTVPTVTIEPPASAMPTAISEPVNFSGSGDMVENLDSWTGPAIVWVMGNKTRQHFAVKAYDENGQMIDLLVNTADSYEGEIWMTAGVAKLEVTAIGDWSIEIRPLSTGRILVSPGSIEGQGDAILMVGGEPDTARVRGNETRQHFAVKAYDENGQMIDLLVNTADSYDGQMIVPGSSKYIAVSAVGSWSVEME